MTSEGKWRCSMQTISCIESCICIGHGEGPRGRQIIAFCTINTKNNIDPGRIRRQCFGLLAGREVPDTVVVVRDFPMLANGKIDIQKLLLDWRPRRGDPA